LTFGLELGAIYGGFHYAVDVIAGVAAGSVFALVGLWLAERLKRVVASDQANAMAPT
jgi:membrane-associated phospholipid phosphatase